MKPVEQLAKKSIHAIKTGFATKKLSSKMIKAIDKIESLENNLDEMEIETKKDIYNIELDEKKFNDYII